MSKIVMLSFSPKKMRALIDLTKVGVDTDKCISKGYTDSVLESLVDAKKHGYDLTDYVCSDDTNVYVQRLLTCLQQGYRCALEVCNKWTPRARETVLECFIRGYDIRSYIESHGKQGDWDNAAKSALMLICYNRAEANNISLAHKEAGPCAI